MRSSVDERIQKYLNSEFEIGESELIRETKKQLLEYLNGNRQVFELEYVLCGSDFQKQVWEELAKIPFGKVNSYLELSNKINNPKAIRAVASANGANSLAIVIPCHRIIGQDGKLVGYAGGLRIKQKLLSIEQKDLFSSNNIDIE